MICESVIGLVYAPNFTFSFIMFTLIVIKVNQGKPPPSFVIIITPDHTSSFITHSQVTRDRLHLKHIKKKGKLCFLTGSLILVNLKSFNENKSFRINKSQPIITNNNYNTLIQGAGPGQNHGHNPAGLWVRLVVGCCCVCG